MIRILFIMPYPEMEDEIRTILSGFKCDEEISYKCELHNYTDLYDYHTDIPYDIVLARGYSADVILKNNPAFVVQKITFNSVDTINAVENCTRLFHSKKIAVVGHPSLVYAAETIKKICDIPIQIYNDYGPDTIYDDIFNKALSDGCDTIIAGRFPCSRAAELGIPNYIARINPESLYQAISDAIQAFQTNKNQHIQLQLLQMVMNNSSEGYLFFNEKGKLSICNQYASNLFSQNGQTVISCSYKDILPELSEKIDNAYYKNVGVNNELFKCYDKTFTAHITPVLSDSNSEGILIDFRDVDSIQEMEFQVRRQLTSKGMVTHYNFENIIHKSQVITRLIDIAKHFASADSNIIIEGMTGTGKELFAHSIHSVSKRSKQPFVAVNCASIPENLLESELFGYAPGAFTGASKEGKQGLFELAHNGTLFLDEIAELPYSFQGKLLRVLQEHEVRRIGDDRIIPVNVRIIAATNKNLTAMVMNNTFRRDLLFRLNILQLYIPPLNERTEDIPLIFQYFIKMYAIRLNKALPIISNEMEHLLKQHEWIGNIRELKNVAERFMVLYSADSNTSELLINCINPAEFFSTSQIYIEKNIDEAELIENALRRCNDRQAAAEMLGMSRSTLWRKMKKYNIKD